MSPPTDDEDPVRVERTETIKVNTNPICDSAVQLIARIFTVLKSFSPVVSPQSTAT